MASNRRFAYLSVSTRSVAIFTQPMIEENKKPKMELSGENFEVMYTIRSMFDINGAQVDTFSQQDELSLSLFTID